VKSKSKLKGKKQMANYQLGDTEKAPYTLTVLDAASAPATLKPGDVIDITSSDTESATIVPDATPVAGSVASGWVMAGRKVQPNVVLTATLTPGDGGPILSTTDTIDIVGGSANSISFGLGAPVAQ
jgi:hypothetical protein